jgi:hypothetical protein
MNSLPEQLLRYVVALSNPGKTAKPQHCWYTDDAAGHARRDQFVAALNGHPDLGIFYCIDALREQGTARRDRIVAVYEIVADLDLAHIRETLEQVIEVLKNLPLPPSEIRISGHGLHAVWYLKEPATGDDIAVAAAIMKVLSGLLASDSSVTRPEQLLRLPGTKNTKDLDPAMHRDCEVIWSSPTHVDLTDFDVLLDIPASRGALLTAKEKTAPRTNGHTAWTNDTPDMRSAEETLAQLRYGSGKFHNDLRHATLMMVTADFLLVEVAANRAFNRACEVMKDNPEGEEWDMRAERSTRYVAATALLDRGYGRPAQSLDLHLSADAITKRLSDMTDAELAALEARMIAAAPIVLEATAEVSDDADDVEDSPPDAPA